MLYRPEIDGLRAVAVVPVILFHAGLASFSGGYVGVDVFFVLSGYLITSILIEELQAERFSITRFYERRARRILPALFLVLACTTAAGWIWMTPIQLAEYSRTLVAVVLFASNVYFWRTDDYFAPAAELNPLLHTWSLAVEEQFYIFFPLALSAAWRFGRQRLLWGTVLLSLASLALAQWGSTNASTPNFFLIPSRAWELGAGSLCALLLANAPPRSNSVLSGLGLALIVGSVFVFDEATPFPSLLALAPVGGAALVILYGGSDTPVARLLSMRLVVGIGLISYSAYLWHQPLFAFAQIRSLTHPSVALMMTLALASFVLAYVSWRFVENPFRRRASPLPSRRAVFAASGVVAAGLIGAGVYGLVTDGREDGWQPPTPEAGLVHRLQAEAERIKQVYLDDGACQFNVIELDPATIERIQGCRRLHGPGVAVIGDSHARDLFNGMYANHEGAFVFGMTFWGCQFGANEADCDFGALEGLLRDAPDTFEIILYHVAGQRLLAPPKGKSIRDFLSRIPEHGRVSGQGIETFDERIERELQGLAAFGRIAPVVWVGPRIEPHIGLNYMLEGGCDHPFTLREGQGELFVALDDALATSAKAAGVEYVSLIDAVAFDMSTDFMTCDRLYWFDSSHWSYAGARIFVERLLDYAPTLGAKNARRHAFKSRPAADADRFNIVR